MKQHLTGRHVSTIGYIILILSQQVFTLAP